MSFLCVNGVRGEFCFLLHTFLCFPNFLQCLYNVVIILQSHFYMFIDFGEEGGVGRGRERKREKH